MSGLDWDVLLVQFVALGLGALIKGATGQGLPVVSIPLLAIFLGVPHAIAILIILIVATNFWQVWQFRHEGREAEFLPSMLLAGMAGIVVGTMALKHFAVGWSSLCLGLILTGYIGLRVGKPSFRHLCAHRETAGAAGRACRRDHSRRGRPAEPDWRAFHPFDEFAARAIDLRDIGDVHGFRARSTALDDLRPDV